MRFSLSELADELRIELGETHLTPDQFKSKYGRCPIGFHTDPATNRCQRIGMAKAPSAHKAQKPTTSPAAVTHFAKKPAAPSPSAAPTKSNEPKTTPAKKAPEPAAQGAEHGKSEHGFLRKALHHVWDAVTDPFKKMWKLATDKKYRHKVKKFIVNAAKKEGSQTKEMAKHIARALKGEKLTKAERDAVMDQMADIVKVAILGTAVGHVAAGGLAKLAATLASPADEMCGIAIDKPLRKLTKKFFGREHGILPTSFYEPDEDEKSENLFLRLNNLLTEAYKEGDEYKVIEQMVDAILQEMGKTDLDEKEIMKALMKSGLRSHKKNLIDKIIGAFSKKEAKEPCGKCGSTSYKDIRGKLGDCCAKKESVAVRMRALL